MGDGGEKRSVGQSEVIYGSVINRSVRGTVVEIPSKKSDTVNNTVLIILPCQVVATNMSDFNKHEVLERE